MLFNSSDVKLQTTVLLIVDVSIQQTAAVIVAKGRII